MTLEQKKEEENVNMLVGSSLGGPKDNPMDIIELNN